MSAIWLGPVNTAVIYGTNVTLNCTSAGSLHQWYHGTTYLGISGFDQYPGNYSIIQTNNVSILSINTAPGNVFGEYSCFNPMSPPQMYGELIVLGEIIIVFTFIFCATCICSLKYSLRQF